MSLRLLKVCDISDIIHFFTNELNSVSNLIIPIYEEVIPRFTKKYPLGQYTYHFEDTCTANKNDNEISMMYLEEIINSHNCLCDNNDYICFYSNKISECTDELFLSLLYAKYSNRKLLYTSIKNEIHDLILNNIISSVFVILPFHEFSSMERFLLREKNPHVNIGYLPYYNKFTINFYILKYIMFNKASYNGASIIFNRVDQDADNIISIADSNYYLPRKFCTKDSIFQILNSYNEFLEFNYMSHCRECVLRFNDFIYCGMNNIIDECKVDDKHLPCCYYDKCDCYIENIEKHNVSEINASFYFLNGCNIGDLNNSIIPYNYTVVSNLIENNSISIITSAGIKTGNIAENILAHNLLYNGYSVGEIENEINKFLEYSKIETNNYFLLGDPLFRVSGKSIISAKYKKSLLDDGTLDVQISEIQNETYIEIPIDELTGCIFINDILFDKQLYDKKNDIYFYITKCKDADRQKLIIFSRAKFSVNTIQVKISNNDNFEQQINELKEYLDRINFLKEQFPLENIYKGKIIDIENNLKKVLMKCKTYKFSINGFLNLKNSILNMKKKFEHIFESIFNDVTLYTNKQQNNFYEDVTERRSTIEKVSYDNICTSCQDVTLMNQYKICSIGRTYYRTSIKCYKCGLIQDVPDFNLGISSYLDLKFDIKGNDINIMELTNNSNKKIKLMISAVCIDSKDIIVQMKDSIIELKPNKSHVVSIFVKPKANLKKHYYLFSFYIMAEGNFYYISKTLSYQ
ncbi:hypothetical protein [Thermotalea metallivorans]|uniref:Uncharacterized protein n=1 Tax=Thermotalea metallivorans TaxID=520762 RepID=A0A140LCF6_9FIRM|nr:hypothetical protein [Thermotalea metallivorans]KXG78231.1 hypothetical protein AN619_02060 [Thermotalea metallivorans]